MTDLHANRLLRACNCQGRPARIHKRRGSKRKLQRARTVGDDVDCGERNRADAAARLPRTVARADTSRDRAGICAKRDLIRLLDRAKRLDIAADQAQRTQIVSHPIEVRRRRVEPQGRLVAAQSSSMLKRQHQRQPLDRCG